jgi:flavin-dependent dehydrogenase
VVVGAGPAGAAAALEAKRLRPQATVALVDKAGFPRDKACGDGLGPHAVDELEALGAAGVLEGYPPIRGLRLRSPRGMEVAGDPARPNFVIPRSVLDARLVEAATTARRAVSHAPQHAHDHAEAVVQRHRNAEPVRLREHHATRHEVAVVDDVVM